MNDDDDVGWLDEFTWEVGEGTTMDVEEPKMEIVLHSTYHYFRSISELKDCKHGGYLKGSIQIYGNSSKVKDIQLELVPSEDLSNKIVSNLTASENTYNVESVMANLHCNLLYISTSSSNRNPDITKSGWRINLKREDDTMILSRENHLYLEEDLDSELFWRDSENKLILGPEGLRITIVKPLSKEDKASRPGIYVKDVLEKRFEESLFIADTDLQNEKVKFHKTHLTSRNRKSKECEPFRLVEYFTKNREMYKAKLQVTCTFENNSTITDTSQIIYASNKYIIEIEEVNPELIRFDGVCQEMTIVLKKWNHWINFWYTYCFQIVSYKKVLRDFSYLIHV